LRPPFDPALVALHPRRGYYRPRSAVARQLVRRSVARFRGSDGWSNNA